MIDLLEIEVQRLSALFNQLSRSSTRLINVL